MYAKLICALSLSALLFACNRNAEHAPAKDLTLPNAGSKTTAPTAEEANRQIPMPAQVTADSVNEGGTPAATTAPVAPVPVNIDWNKKIIKTATVKLEVKNFKNYNELLYNKVKQYGGYIAQENDNLTSERSEAVVAIKVPVQYFDGIMNDLTSADGKLVEKNISTEDVTGDVVDTKARLEAKKQVRLKYLDFLKESKNMSEVLQVQNEVNTIQEEIEAASGRLSSLNNQAAYSTINLTFYQPVVGDGKTVDDEPGFGGRTASAFRAGASWVAKLLVALVSIWPLLLIAAAGIYGYKKRKPAKVLPQNV